MNGLLKKAVGFMVTIFIISGMTVSAFAEESNVEYSGNTGVFIFDADGETELKDLFSGFKDVMPGDVLTQSVVIKNKADDTVKVVLYLRSLGADEESADFLSQVRLTVSKKDDTPLFDSKANETAGLTDWTEIGILYGDNSISLELKLEVPTTLDNSFSGTFGNVRWEFTAVEMPVNETTWTCPNCHESHYHIDDLSGEIKYVCENCKAEEKMYCEICGHEIQKVVYRDETGREWYFYQCVDEVTHHTEPTPKTGDTVNMTLWIVLFGVGISGAAILFFVLRRKKNAEVKQNE